MPEEARYGHDRQARGAEPARRLMTQGAAFTADGLSSMPVAPVVTTE